MQGTEPLDIILVRRGGTLTGEAYVLLRLPIQVEHVLSKNKTYLGQRYIEVALAKKLVSLIHHLSRLYCSSWFRSLQILIYHT